MRTVKLYLKLNSWIFYINILNKRKLNSYFSDKNFIHKEILEFKTETKI